MIFLSLFDVISTDLVFYNYNFDDADLNLEIII
jgi:hypothetical protein